MISITTSALYDRITNDLRSNQKPVRLLHIFGVLQTAVALAKIHGGNLEQVTLAALLHDCAKHVTREDTLDLFNKGLILLSTTDMEFPAIWHGTVAAHVARTLYQVTDPEVLHAVEHHTLGCPHPSLTLQILMCADFCEPTRQYEPALAVRELVRHDLRKGLRTILDLKIKDLLNKDQKPHPRIYSTIDSLES